MNYSKGICWMDDCRIPYLNEKDKEKNTDGLERFIEHRNKRRDIGYGFSGGKSYETNTQGRFPANLLVSDDMLNDGNIIQYNKTRKDNGTYLGGHREVYVGEGEIKKKVKGDFYSDKGTNSRYYDIDKWFEKMINEL